MRTHRHLVLSLLAALATSGCSTLTGMVPDKGAPADPSNPSQPGVDDPGDVVLDDTGVITPGTGDCPDDLTFFEDEVWRPILQTNCVSCHSATGIARGTRMVLTAGATDLQGDFDTVMAVAAIVDASGPLMLSKPMNTHAAGHGGGRRVSPGSAQADALSELVDRAAGIDPCLTPDPSTDPGTNPTGPTNPPTCGPVEPGARRLRRLSHTEYDRTVSDLLGVSSAFGDGFAPDVVVDGFRNNGDVLEVSPLLVDQYRQAAEALAFDELPSVDPLMPCDPAVDGERDCASEFIIDFGRKAFRRPLVVAEHDQYLGFFDEVRTEERYSDAVRWVIAAMLQSPGFLYRPELGYRTAGNAYALSDYELASELSYLVWSTMPDATLLDAAEDGELSTPAGLQAQVTRMLADDRARSTMSRFTEAWLRLDQLDNVSRDAVVYPELTQAVRDQMRGETDRYVDDLFAAGGTLDDLFVGDHTFVTASLAGFYGLPSGSGSADAQGYRRVATSGTGYGGLLTQGSFLTLYSNPTNSSPVHRGVAVRERILCQHLPPPPAGLNISPPTPDPNATTRERFEQHRADPACAGCHDLIDPVGYGFETFDGIGRYRTTENGLPIDASGVVEDIDGGNSPFDGVAELSTMLSGSEEVRSCYVRQWVRYGHGLTDDATTACRVDWVEQAFQTSGGRLEDVVIALLADTHFTARTGTAGELDAPFLTDIAVPLEQEPDDTDTQAGGTDDTGWTPGDLDPRLGFRVETQSDWGAGYCANVFIDNPSSDMVRWSLTYDVGSRLANAWNSQTTDLGSGSTIFEGASWNQDVYPGATVSFGYCADR